MESTSFQSNSSTPWRRYQGLLANCLPDHLHISVQQLCTSIQQPAKISVSDSILFQTILEICNYIYFCLYPITFTQRRNIQNRKPRPSLQLKVYFITRGLIMM